MGSSSKRLILFAPDGPGWSDISEFENVVHHPSQAGGGLSEVDYGTIVEFHRQLGERSARQAVAPGPWSRLGQRFVRLQLGKIPDQGEDSDPILRDGPDLGLIAVFDMGGAGAHRLRDI